MITRKERPRLPEAQVADLAVILRVLGFREESRREGPGVGEGQELIPKLTDGDVVVRTSSHEQDVLLHVR